MGIDIVTMQECSSWQGRTFVPGSKPGTTYIVYWNGPEGAPYCERTDGEICPAYKYSGDERSCRHINAAAKETCHWHEQWSEESIETDGVCPRCGNSTIYVRCAV